MTKNILIILLSGLTIFACAQNKNAEQLLEEVNNNIQSYDALSIDFSYSIEFPDDGSRENGQGKLDVSGDKYRLKIIGQHVYSNGKTMWTYITDAEEVQINSVTEDNGMITPTNLLTFYKKKYKARSLKEEIMNDTPVYVVELKPEEDKNISKVNLYIDKDQKLIRKLALHDQNGGTTTYTLDEYEMNPPLTEKDFIFNTEQHPDVEIIDMR